MVDHEDDFGKFSFMFKKNFLTQEEVMALLNCRRLPGCIGAPEVAALMGLNASDIPVLTKAKMLIPLGSPSPNAPKHFAADDIEKATRNRAFMHKATLTLARNYREKNERRKSIKNTND